MHIDFLIALNGLYNTSAGLTFRLNKMPTGGDCGIDIVSGFVFETQFLIFCIDWFDPDGYVATYEFYGN